DECPAAPIGARLWLVAETPATETQPQAPRQVWARLRELSVQARRAPAQQRSHSCAAGQKRQRKRSGLAGQEPASVLLRGRRSVRRPVPEQTRWIPVSSH